MMFLETSVRPIVFLKLWCVLPEISVFWHGAIFLDISGTVQFSWTFLVLSEKGDHKKGVILKLVALSQCRVSVACFRKNHDSFSGNNATSFQGNNTKTRTLGPYLYVSERTQKHVSTKLSKIFRKWCPPGSRWHSLGIWHRKAALSSEICCFP